MSLKKNPAVLSMSLKDMEITIFDILTDNGMSEDDARKTLDGMSLKDMESYITTALEGNE